MRVVAAMTVFASIILFANTAGAECYSCNFTSQGIPYCATRNSGFQTCSANPQECYAADKCGGGWGMDPEEPIVMNKCPDERWLLVNVDVDSNRHEPVFVLASANYGAKADRRLQ